MVWWKGGNEPPAHLRVRIYRKLKVVRRLLFQGLSKRFGATKIWLNFFAAACGAAQRERALADHLTKGGKISQQSNKTGMQQQTYAIDRLTPWPPPVV